MRTASLPRWWPARVYYGWAMVATLGVTATVSYGVLSYAFAVFITPMSEELGWSKAQITGAYSLGQLVAGAAAIPLGRWIDRHGARGVMTAGALLATLMLVGWSRVHSITAFYLVWTLLGVATAAVFYEPAFAIVATWFHHGRGRALTVLTFIGGFASVVFVPVATLLVERHGWRDALLWLAAIYAPLTIIPHALVLRRRPADLGLLSDGRSTPLAPGTTERSVEVRPIASELVDVPAKRAIRSAPFRWVTLAFALSAVTTTAISVHLVPMLRERGYSASLAGGAMGVLGLMALPGRLVFTPLGTRWSRTVVAAMLFMLSAVAIAVLISGRGPASVWTFAVLFGAGFGAITPARAALIAETFGATSYAEISGVLTVVLSVARAAAPVGASVLYETTRRFAIGGYDAVLVALLILTVGSALAVLAAGVRNGR